MLSALLCSNSYGFALMAESDHEQLILWAHQHEIVAAWQNTALVCLCSSYLEIYNERVHDLLKKKAACGDGVLRVREHPQDGPYVESKTAFLPEKSQRKENRHALLCVQICLNAWFTTTATWRISWFSATPIAPQAARPWIPRAAALTPSLL